jgi:hypothetical protein
MMKKFSYPIHFALVKFARVYVLSINYYIAIPMKFPLENLPRILPTLLKHDGGCFFLCGKVVGLTV